LSLLKTYNCYHEGKSFQIRNQEEEGELIIEGLLNISCGLRRPIRLQMHDDNERVHFSYRYLYWEPEVDAVARLYSGMLIDGTRDGAEAASAEVSKGAAETDDAVKNACSTVALHHFICSDLDSEMSNTEEETSQLMRTKSEASFMNAQRRSKYQTSGEMQRIKRHRFSINGHLYNHKFDICRSIRDNDTEYKAVAPSWYRITSNSLTSCNQTIYSALRSMIQQQLEDISENDNRF
ncbi:ras association domain-containing protein 4-like, partial [Polyodon spathula]|uniref:ras association domain-containing protein 4-like n=1 Tax=Polyodon spathula TaxID=7913 RepID=UPI001B7DE598